MLVLLILSAFLQTGDPKAIEIADEMVKAMGGEENWERARFIRFTNVRQNRRATFSWDRWNGRLRLEARDEAGIPYVVLMSLSSRQGLVFLDGKPLRGAELSEYLNRAVRMWTGATYWFLMPFKWKDEGVVLAYDGEEEIDGILYDKVHLTFDDVGRTPGDQYWAYVNRETHFMDRWKYRLEGGATGDYQWRRWHRYSGIRVAVERVGNDEVIRFEDIVVAESMPDEIFTSPEPP